MRGLNPTSRSAITGLGSDYCSAGVGVRDWWNETCTLGGVDRYLGASGNYVLLRDA